MQQIGVMSGDQDGAVDPSHDHIEEGDDDAGRDGSDRNFDQEPD